MYENRALEVWILFIVKTDGLVHTHGPMHKLDMKCKYKALDSSFCQVALSGSSKSGI